MNLPLLNGLKLINYAIEQEIDSKLWQMWIALYPYMTEENSVSFKEFRKKHLGKKEKKHKQTEDEMMMMAMAINAAFNGEVIEQ